MHLRHESEIDSLTGLRNDCRVKGLIAVWFWLGDIILDAVNHRSIKAVELAQYEIAGRDIFDNDTQGHEVIDIVDICTRFIFYRGYKCF